MHLYSILDSFFFFLFLFLFYSFFFFPVIFLYGAWELNSWASGGHPQIGSVHFARRCLRMFLPGTDLPAHDQLGRLLAGSQLADPHQKPHNYCHRPRWICDRNLRKYRSHRCGILKYVNIGMYCHLPDLSDTTLDRNFKFIIDDIQSIPIWRLFIDFFPTLDSAYPPPLPPPHAPATRRSSFRIQWYVTLGSFQLVFVGSDSTGNWCSKQTLVQLIHMKSKRRIRIWHGAHPLAI